MSTFKRSSACAALVLALSGLQPAAAQTPRPYTLSVKAEGRYTYLSLKAENARVSDVAADLGKRLNAKIVVGPAVQRETVSVNLTETPLEQVLLSLAPRVFIDYEIRQDATPRPLGIYLLGLTDPVPSTETAVAGMSQAFVIEGNTEDVPKDPKDDPLKVVGNRHFLTVNVKQQPLSVVARAIGDVLGIPVEMKYDATELIDANLTNGLPEETVVGLTPNARLYVRVDVNLGERTPLKLLIEKASAR